MLIIFGSFSRLGNLSFALVLGSTCRWRHGLVQQFVLFVSQQFPLFFYFLQALHCMVSLGLSSVKHHCGYINTLFVDSCCWKGIQNPSHAKKSTEKVCARVSEENHSNRLQTGLFDIKVSVFLKNLSILLRILSQIFQNVSVHQVKP